MGIRWLFVFVLLPLVLHAEEPRFAPRFVLNDLSSREIRLADLQGKVVLLGFWASWSKPCQDEMAEMEALWEKYKGRSLTVLGINEDEADRLEAVKKAVLDRKINYANLLDPTHAVQQAYGVKKFPCLILIDYHGMINRVEAGSRAGEDLGNFPKAGPAGPDSLELELHKLLAESESKPTLSVGAVLAADSASALKERVRKAVEAKVKGVRDYRFVPRDDTDFELSCSAAKLGKSVGLTLSLVDGHNHRVVRRATDSASESELEAMVGRMIKQLGLR